MKLGLCAAVTVLALWLAAGNAGAAATPAVVENWAYTHPDAAFELWSWARENPAAARTFSQWDAMNRKRSKALVSWAVAHPGTSIEVFVENHPGWTDLREVTERHRSAARQLLAWCRTYPAAARALMKSSRQHRAPAARQLSR